MMPCPLDSGGAAAELAPQRQLVPTLGTGPSATTTARASAPQDRALPLGTEG
jgi:hypothetical protein